MRVSRRLRATASGALSLLPAGALCCAAQAAGTTGSARTTQASAWAAEDSSDDSYILDASSSTITPKPCRKGTPLTITVHGRLKEAARPSPGPRPPTAAAPSRGTW
ncbi:hypothetical protein KCMC57_up57860 [Kitasatospora sp. CMC57]|uniref:Secreted protein n=1 Tax=Kitasatospora sp. CMC57 TaxID=3231513 RepID=A0AB33KDB9_9ACTN